MLLPALLLAAAPCFEFEARTPGWKQVPVPADAPHLAAPPSLSQFRSDERFTFVEHETGLFANGQVSGGATDFELVLPSGTKAVTVVFGQSLRGAKVDVTSFGMTLVHEKRVGGDRLSFAWGPSGVSRVFVRVHQHLREPPVLMEKRVEREVFASELGLSAKWLAPGTLSFFQPDDTPVRLCEAPAQSLRVSDTALPRP